MIDWNELADLLHGAARSVGAEVTSPWFYLQIGLIVVAAGIAVVVSALTRRNVTSGVVAMGWPAPVRLFVRTLLGSAGTVAFALITGIMRAVMTASTWPSRSYLLAVAASLATAWLVIRFATSFIRNEFAVRVVSLGAWLIAALSILGLLRPTTEALDSVAIDLGGVRLTLLLVLKLCASLAAALWIANLFSKFVEGRINRSRDLTPSVQVLMIKLVRLLLMGIAVVLVLGAVGINLSALAVFTGAVGVGVGLGLQKIIANFISGVILLADKSVKPGDLVTVGDSFGRINTMNTRYISVAAGDGREFLIPNEDLITQKVTNWTYADKDTLVKVPFSANYDADPRIVCKLAVDVAAAIDRVKTDKPPNCQVTEFAEYGMRFALTFWIDDPYAGMDNVKSDVMMALWEAFKREGIRVPYPVRDIRVRGTLPVDTVIETSAG